MPEYVPFLFIGVAIIVGAAIISYGLYAIANAINNSDADVHASVVNSSKNKAKLVLRSDSTGSDYGVSLSDVSGSLLSNIGLVDDVQATDSTGGYIYDDSELDAQYELDGILLTSNSNTIEDAISGITFNLVGTQEEADEPIQLTIDADNDSIQEN